MSVCVSTYVWQTNVLFQCIKLKIFDAANGERQVLANENCVFRCVSVCR